MSNPPSPSSPLTSGVIGVDWYATHVATRLQDFFFATTPWQRRLWDAGTVSALKELLDAAMWRAAHVLSESTVQWLAHELEQIVGRDHGIGDRSIKVAIAAELKAGVAFDTRHWRRLEQLIPRVENGYLQRWSVSVDSPHPPGAERVARAVASHLLDRGYSMAFLHSWTRRHIRDGHSLQELLADSFTLDAQVDRTYTVMLPIESVPLRANAEMLSNWLNAPQVAAWLAHHGGQGPKPIRYQGAFNYQVMAKDPYAAARIVSGVLERLYARASYGPHYSKMQACGVVWVQEEGRLPKLSGVPTFDVRPQHRGTYVRSLMQENKVHDVGLATTPLDDALELAASLNNSSSPGPAIVGGWSALESLLFSAADPQDGKEGRGVAACDRAAALVACSWPRAELTSLAHAHLAEIVADGQPERLVGELAVGLGSAKGRDPSVGETYALFTDLAAAGSNHRRCETVLAAYSRGQRLELRKASDVAAQERMLALVASPRDTVNEVRGHVLHAFRRMYRYRNIVVHGGAASSRGLEVALRTAAPLAGAALDRVAHAALVDELSALALAARADIHIDLLGSPAAPGLQSLLE